MGYNFII